MRARNPKRKSADLRPTIVSASSRKLFKSISKLAVDYRRLDYKDTLPMIIKIQSWWKMKKQREYYQALLYLHQRARTIQKLWRGYSSRKRYPSVSIIGSIVTKIQKAYRKHLERRNEAARTIQLFVLDRIRQKYLTSTEKFTDLINQPQMLTAQRALLKKGKFTEPTYSFTPTLIKQSKKLAEELHTRKGSSHLKVEDRLLLQERVRQGKISDLQKEKASREFVGCTYSPAIKNRHQSSVPFYERQKQKQEKFKAWREKESIHKAWHESRELSFQPKTNIRKASSHHKVSNKMPLPEQHSQFKISGRNLKIVQKRKLKSKQSYDILQRFNKLSGPYWPNI